MFSVKYELQFFFFFFLGMSLATSRGLHRPYVCCNFVTELRRQQAEILQNHDSENVRGMGLGQTQRREYKRVRHYGDEAWRCV